MKKWMTVFFFVLVVAFTSACSNATDSGTTTTNSESQAENSMQEQSKLQLLENDKVGQYLADAQGKTLYYFTKDKQKVSNCKGDCLQKWPAFSANNLEIPEGFTKEDFATITREDTGQKQVTYKGYPLYYFANDKTKGDVNGQGVKNAWYTVNQKTKFKQ